MAKLRKIFVTFKPNRRLISFYVKDHYKSITKNKRYDRNRGAEAIKRQFMAKK